METIKFETNMPQVLALAFAEGKPVESQFTGAQVMFSTVDGRRMYLAPFVAEKIRAAGIAARIPFEICKKQVGRSIEWQVRTHNAAAGAVSEATPTAAQVRSSNQTVPKEYNDDGRHDQAMAAPIPAAAAQLTQTGTKLMGALAAAVDAVMEAEIYCARHGREIRFTSEDVRALAITVYISDCKGGGA
ncbi:MAG: hypothetical protein ABJF23_30370 [Bryobacteraceae bacterium]